MLLPETYIGLGCINCGATGTKVFTTGQVKKTKNCLTRPKTCITCGAVSTSVETIIGCVPPAVVAAPAPVPVVVSDEPPSSMTAPVAVVAIAQPVAVANPLAAVAPAPIVQA